MHEAKTQRYIEHRAHVRRLDICRSICVWGMRREDVAKNWNVAVSTVKTIHQNHCVIKRTLTPMSDFQYSTKKAKDPELARLSHSV